MQTTVKDNGIYSYYMAVYDQWNVNKISRYLVYLSETIHIFNVQILLHLMNLCEKACIQKLHVIKDYIGLYHVHAK